MKIPIQNWFRFPALLLTLALGGTGSLTAAPAPAKPLPKSVFTLPHNPAQGRDPFFPDSMRPYERFHPNMVASAGTPSLKGLSLNGLLGRSHRVYAVINDYTFAPGDEEVVTTSDGRRLRIRCVAINSENQTVTVAAGGRQQVLTLSNKP